MNVIQTVKERQLDIFYSGYYLRTNKKTSYELIPAEIEGTYKYADVDYGDTSRTGWSPADHCHRLENELVFGGRERLVSDDEWRDKILGALRYYLAVEPDSDNWWYNQICAASSLGAIAVVLGDHIDPDMRELLENRITIGSFKPHLMLGINSIAEITPVHVIDPADTWTGANLIWGAVTTIRHALWTKDEELLKIAVKRICDEICYSREGIQEDGGFCQHGPRWYSGGYGRSFVYEMAPIVNLFCGTELALPEEKLNVILNHILEGQRYMQRGGYFDFGAVGREYTRKGQISMKSMASPLKLLANADGIPRKDELLQFLDTVQGNGDSFEGTKYFDSLAVLTHKKNGMYIGIRGRRSGILGAEKCNEESVLAYNMSYGTVSCVMQSGKEYYNISPVWDYAKIPGTTARSESDDELLAHEKWSETLESPCKTRGAVEGDIGILTEYCEHDGVSLNATFFTFDGSLVALGADIKVDDGAEVYTTVEQCIADSVIIGDSTVINGDVIYKNLDERCEFLTTAQAVAGDWKRNSRFMNSTPDIADVLTVVIPNTTGGSYAYLVTNDEENTVKVVSNDSYCQAIELGDGKVLAAFHEDFELAIGERKICGKAGDFIFG